MVVVSVFGQPAYYFYYLRWRMPPFMRQCWGLQVGPMHETAGMGKLINAALLSLMRRVWVYAVLPSSWVDSSALLVCRRDRVTREVARVGGGILSGVVPVYLYCPAFNVSVSLGVYSRHTCLQAAQPLSIPRTVGPGRGWAVRADTAYSSLPTCSPAPSVIAD